MKDLKDGYEAEIRDGVVTVRKQESEDENIRKECMRINKRFISML